MAAHSDALASPQRFPIASAGNALATFDLGDGAATIHAYGGTCVIAFDDRITTFLPDGQMVHAWPNDDEESRARAASLGYPDVLAMTLEHDPLHVRLCHALGLPESPALRAALTGEASLLTEAEEAMVLAAQRFLNLVRSEAQCSSS